MTETNSVPQKLDRRLLGEAIEIDGRSIQAVARVHGRCDAGGNAQGSGAGCRLNVEPVELIVREADGAESRVALADPSVPALRALARVTLVVAAVSIALAVLARRRGPG